MHSNKKMIPIARKTAPVLTGRHFSCKILNSELKVQSESEMLPKFYEDLNDVQKVECKNKLRKFNYEGDVLIALENTVRELVTHNHFRYNKLKIVKSKNNFIQITLQAEDSQQEYTQIKEAQPQEENSRKSHSIESQKNKLQEMLHKKQNPTYIQIIDDSQ